MKPTRKRAAEHGKPNRCNICGEGKNNLGWLIPSAGDCAEHHACFLMAGIRSRLQAEREKAIRRLGTTPYPFSEGEYRRGVVAGIDRALRALGEE